MGRSEMTRAQTRVKSNKNFEGVESKLSGFLMPQNSQELGSGEEANLRIERNTGGLNEKFVSFVDSFNL